MSDVFLELVLNSWPNIPIRELSLDQCYSIGSDVIPESFYRMYPKLRNFRFQYVLKRINLNEVPFKESYWWDVFPETKVFTFFAKEYPQNRKYTAVDFAENEKL